LIESASKIANKGGTAQVIKTHHNDTQLVRQLREQGRVVEPLTDYHKDEVRSLGISLGLPEDIVWRQPFPGPGLAIRIICARRQYLTAHDAILVKQLHEFETPTIAVCLMAIRTVGVQGDGRSYGHCVGLSHKARGERVPWKTLYRLAKDIPSVLHSVNRCVFLFGSPISGHCTEITPTLINDDSVEQIRECDAVVRRIFDDKQISRTLSQTPVILFPQNFGVSGCRSVCLRPFITRDFMTGTPAVIEVDIPSDVLMETVEALQKIKNVSRVALDLTSKPPGTTEWE